MFNNKKREQALLAALQRIMNGGGRVLEVGCDAQDVQRMLAACVQIAREAIEQAKA